MHLLPEGYRNIFMPREDNTTSCITNEGRGFCTQSSRCPGISTSGICTGFEDGVECCLIHDCKVPQGKGHCRSAKNNGCPDGELVPSKGGPPHPCIGPKDIQCCVKFDDFYDNYTATTTSSSTNTPTTPIPLPTTETATAAASETADPDSGLPMAKGEIAGIVVGSIGCVALFALVLYIAKRRKKANAKQDNINQNSIPSAKWPHELPDTAGMRVKPTNIAAPIVHRRGSGVVEAPADEMRKFSDKKDPRAFMFDPGNRQPRELDSTPAPHAEFYAIQRPAGSG